MMEDENDEITRVSFSTYKKYFQYCGVFRALVGPAVILGLFTVASIVTDYIIGAWAVAGDQYTNYWYYFKLLWIATVSIAVLIFLKIWLLNFGTLAAG